MKNEVIYPAYNTLVDSLKQRINLMHKVYGVVIILLSANAVWDKYQNHIIQNKLDKKEFVALPSVLTNWTTFRVNGISDAVIFEFSDWYIENIGNWKWSSIERKNNYLARYQTPKLQVHIENEQLKLIEFWKTNRIAQEYEFSPSKSVKRLKDQKTGRTIFKTSVWGEITESINGIPQKPWREKITITFRMSPIDNTKSWIFEVVSQTRETEKEIKLKEIALKKEGKKNG